MSKIQVEINNKVIEKESFVKMLEFCVPRPEKKIIINIRPRTPWSFPISLWSAYDYQYEGEPEDVYDNAFEFDYNRGNFSKDVKEDKELFDKLKEILKRNYSKM
jgi:hypothetical protein